MVLDADVLPAFVILGQLQELPHVERVVERLAADAPVPLGLRDLRVLQRLGVRPVRAQHDRADERPVGEHRLAGPRTLVGDQVRGGLSGGEHHVVSLDVLVGDVAGAHVRDVDAETVLHQDAPDFGILEEVPFGGHLGLDRDDPVERHQQMAGGQEQDQADHGDRECESECAAQATALGSVDDQTGFL
ncbi:hypothetical protein ACRJ4W_39505 [Streptomyces sp. GLT-R25]